MESRYALKRNDIVRTSTNGGTWMHRKLALKFAAWLSPEFENWVYDIIDDLMFGNLKQINIINQERVNLKRNIAQKETKYYETVEGFTDYMKDKEKLKSLNYQVSKYTKPDMPEFDF